MSRNPLNNLQLLTLSCENADVYAIGHGHDLIANKLYPRRIDAIHGRIQHVEKLYVMSSHWSEFFGGYAARGMFIPNAPGPGQVTFYGDRRKFEATV